MDGGAHGVLTLDSKTFARDLYVFFSADLYASVCVCVYVLCGSML